MTIVTSSESFDKESIVFGTGKLVRDLIFGGISRLASEEPFKYAELPTSRYGKTIFFKKKKFKSRQRGTELQTSNRRRASKSRRCYCNFSQFRRRR